MSVDAVLFNVPFIKKLKVKHNPGKRYSWVKSAVNDRINADSFGGRFVVVGVSVLM
jgi:hypothetical protein